MENIKYITFTLIFFTLLTGCGGTNSSDINSTRGTLVETSTPSEELTLAETPLSVEVSDSNITELDNAIVELPTIGNIDNSDELDVESSTSSLTVLIVNAGEDVTTNVNESITLTGTVSNAGTQSIVYEWKKGIEVLASSISFDYTPKEEEALPTAGHRVDVLTFSVFTNDGNSASDMLNITVLP